MNFIEKTELEILLCSKMGMLRTLAKCFQIHGNDRDDFVQKTLVAAYTGLHQLEDPKKMDAWLTTIARRTMIASGKEQRKIQKHEILYNQEEESSTVLLDLINQSSYQVWQTMEQAFGDKDIAELVDALESPAREIIQMNVAYGFPLTEVAQILDMNYNTVKTIQRRTFAKLKKMML